MRALACLVTLALLTSCATQSSARHDESPSDASAPAATTHAEAVPNDFLVEVHGLALFDDERAEAEELVATWARAEGLAVVPVARARAVFARARAGLHADSGEACGAPLTFDEARTRWPDALGASGRLVATLRCASDEQSCELLLRAYDGLSWSGKMLREWRAPFARERPWREALPVALTALAAPASASSGRGFGSGTGRGGGGGPVQARPERLDLQVRRARVTDQLDDTWLKEGVRFPAGEGRLRACFHEDGFDDELLLEVDEGGRVARCEASTDEASARCACDALTGHASTRPELRSRRLRFRLSFQPADVVTPANIVVTASVHTAVEAYFNERGARHWRPLISDPSIEAWRPPSRDAIERCFVGRQEPSTISALVQLRFDTKGSVAAVEVQPVGWRPVGAAATSEGALGIRDGERECLARLFEAQAKAPCPAVDGARATAEVQVRALRITARQ